MTNSRRSSGDPRHEHRRPAGPPATTGSVDELPYSLVVELTVDDSDTIAELMRHAEGDEREQFAARALRIGVLALRQARGAIDGDAIRREGELAKGLHGKIDEVVREFSLDEENSALSRLVRNVDAAQMTITAEFSLDGEESALSRLSRELRKLLDDQGETNRKFQEEVRATLQSMAVRRAEAERSTRHGVEFEEAVFQQVQQESLRVGDEAEATGNTTGLI